MCLAQGPQRSDAGEARAHGPLVSGIILQTFTNGYLLTNHTIKKNILKPFVYWSIKVLW